MFYRVTAKAYGPNKALQPTLSRVLTHPTCSRYLAELCSALRALVQGG